MFHEKYHYMKGDENVLTSLRRLAMEAAATKSVLETPGRDERRASVINIE